MRCEARTLDDIRKLGGNDEADEQRFATAARVSEMNLALYRTFAQPVVQALVSAPLAKWIYETHPLRLQYEIFSNANPMMAWVAPFADQVRKHRKPVSADNPFLALQENVSRQIETALDAWRDMSEAVTEQMFLAIYGSRTLQAAVGIPSGSPGRLRKASKNPFHQELLQRRIAELRSRIGSGGLREAVIRALLYAGMTRRAIDERGFELARRIRRAHGDTPLVEFKAIVREQFHMLLIDQEAALAAIPSMLPADVKTRSKAFELIRQVLGARGDLSADDKSRLNEVARLFDLDDGGGAVVSPFRPIRKERPAGAPS
jgi:hypothetical protein